MLPPEKLEVRPGLLVQALVVGQHAFPVKRFPGQLVAAAELFQPSLRLLPRLAFLPGKGQGAEGVQLRLRPKGRLGVFFRDGQIFFPGPQMLPRLHGPLGRQKRQGFLFLRPQIFRQKFLHAAVQTVQIPALQAGVAFQLEQTRLHEIVGGDPSPFLAVKDALRIIESVVAGPGQPGQARFPAGILVRQTVGGQRAPEIVGHVHYVPQPQRQVISQGGEFFLFVQEKPRPQPDQRLPGPARFRQTPGKMRRRQALQCLEVPYFFPIGQGLPVSPRLRQSQRQIGLELPRLPGILRQQFPENVRGAQEMSQLHFRQTVPITGVFYFRKIRMLLYNSGKKLRRLLEAPELVSRHRPEILDPGKIVRHLILFPVALQKSPGRQKRVGGLSSFQGKISEAEKPRGIQLAQISRERPENQKQREEKKRQPIPG